MIPTRRARQAGRQAGRQGEGTGSSLLAMSVSSSVQFVQHSLQYFLLAQTFGFA
jgi:hypothetical protein